MEVACANGLIGDVDRLLMRSEPEYAILSDVPFDEIIKSRSRTTGMGFLHFAAKSGDLEVIQFVLSAGADPTALDDARNNALHLLATHGDEGFVAAQAILASVDEQAREVILGSANYAQERPVSVLLFTVTFYANLDHSLTRSP